MVMEKISKTQIKSKEMSNQVDDKHVKIQPTYYSFRGNSRRQAVAYQHKNTFLRTLFNDMSIILYTYKNN
jgi:hypothetical protein